MSSENISGELNPEQRIKLAQEQLSKVQVAWLDPTDWSDLTVYGMYACENAVVAAANTIGLPVKKTHWDKVSASRKLHADHGLPDVADLLEELNELRKGFSYGELRAQPSMSAEDIVAQIETYVEAVASLVDEDHE